MTVADSFSSRDLAFEPEYFVRFPLEGDIKLKTGATQPHPYEGSHPFSMEYAECSFSFEVSSEREVKKEKEEAGM
jgi:hypothetical protein